MLQIKFGNKIKTQNKLLMVYKKNPQDPSLQALIKYIPKKILNVEFFHFLDNERSRFQNENLKFSIRLKNIVEKFKPTHVFCWLVYLNPDEIHYFKKIGVKIYAAVNGFSSLHSGLYKDQKLYFETLKALDGYFVPHRPHIKKLKKHNINAIEMPFFYDPKIYKPINKNFKSFFKKADTFFVGNISNVKIKNTQSYYRKFMIDEISKYYSLNIISNYTNFNSKLKVIKSTKSEKKINFYANISLSSICFDYFPDIKLSKKSYDNVIEPYDDEYKYVIRPRVFAMMGTGTTVFVEKHNEIERFFQNNTNIILWENKDDLIKKLDYYLKSKNELFEIGQNGLNEVRLNHTVSKRLDELIFPEIFN